MKPGKIVIALALSWLVIPGPVWSQEAIPLYNSGTGGPGRPVRGNRMALPEPEGYMVSEGPMNGQPVAMPEGYVAEGAPMQEWEDPELGGHYTFYTSLEFLLWKARRRDQDFAILDQINDGRAQGRIENAQYTGNAAFRIGLGMHLPEEWTATAYYTYFHSANGNFRVAPPGGVLYATQTHPGLVEEAAVANALNSINYNVWDLEFSRQFEVANETFGIRPFGGLRFANISQNMTAYYNGGDATNDFVFTGNNLIAGGIRMGAECSWNMCWGLSLYCRGAGSLLYADYDYTINEANAGATVSNVLGTNQQIVPTLETNLGMAYTYRNFRFSVGYEFINWFGLNDNIDFADDIHQGKFFRRASDLSLSGVTFRTELSF
ncbi:MAG: Lpg1974 family pore-forming outer membrane protein [Gemmataceae bacterium]